MARTAACASALMAAFFVSGCATSSSVAPSDEEAALEMPAWPPPPLEPRIRFVTAYNNAETLGATNSFSDTLNELLTGRKRESDHLRQPMDIAISDDGERLYVADFAVRKVFLLDLVARTMSRVGGENHTWAYPYGVALDGDENVYVTEQEDQKITVLNRAGDTIRVLTDLGLERPTDIEIDRERGLMYVADGSRQNSSNHHVKVFDLEGRFLRNVGKGKGMGDGELMFPSYLALDPTGSVYVTDTVNARVSVFDAEGEFVRQVGQRGNMFGMFDKPKGVAFDTFGNMYVVDSGWSNVQIFNPAGEVLLFFGGRGAFAGMLRNPTAIAIDANNRIYVGDYLNHRVDVYDLVNTAAEDSYVELAPEQ